MPMLVVDDDKFKDELERLSGNVVNNAEIKDISRGRGLGNKEVPEELRKIIGENALIEGNKETAKAFDVSEAAVSAYKKGATSTASYNEPDKDLKKFIDSSRNEISTKARKKLISAIDHISEEKLVECSPKVLASVARDMSSVIRNIEPEETNDKGNNVQFVLFAPQMARESDFAMKRVNE